MNTVDKVGWRLTHTRRCLFASLGLSVERCPAPDTLAWQIKQVLNRFEVDGVLDVGAHHGEFGRFLRSQVGYRGPLVSFEPYAQSFSVLESRFRRDAAWTGYQLALGDVSGSLTLNICDGTELNSVLKPNLFGSQTFGSMRLGGSQVVPVERLDSLTIAGTSIILKTDTQGHDLQVIEGARGMIDRIASVVVELAVIPIYDEAPPWTTVVAYLRQLNFEVAGLFPISRKRDNLGVIEFDGVFVRSS